jgi:hypothetical protein
MKKAPFMPPIYHYENSCHMYKGYPAVHVTDDFGNSHRLRREDGSLSQWSWLLVERIEWTIFGNRGEH